jgi:hypothetical protein
LGSIACLVFSKVPRRAVVIACLAAGGLLFQWLVVTPWIDGSAMRMMQKVAREITQ